MESTLEIGKLRRLSSKNLDAFPTAMQRLNSWRNNSPQLVAMIEQALRNVPYFYVGNELTIVPQYSVSERLKNRCSDMEVKTAIRFLPRYGSFISQPLWEKLDRETQAGLLIHEALRQIQITYQFHMSNEDLEAITATILTGDPSSAKILQDSPLFTGRLGNYFRSFAILRIAGHREVPDTQETCDLAKYKSGTADLCFLALSINFNLALNTTLDGEQMHRAGRNSDQKIWQDLLMYRAIKESAPPFPAGTQY